MIKPRFVVLVAVVALVATLLAGAFALWSDRHISALAGDRTFEELATVPHREAALVLGTSKYANGRLNRFYTARIRAAAELYLSHKVDAILVSGDNGRDDYNEPAAMKADLVSLGVPAEHITCDYAGFRTLDSIYRAEEVFGLRSYTVVSQDFHLERALFLADQKGHDAVGYVAASPGGYWNQRVRAREVLARARAILDVTLLNAQPRYLGQPVLVNTRRSTPRNANGCPA